MAGRQLNGGCNVPHEGSPKRDISLLLAYIPPNRRAAPGRLAAEGGILLLPAKYLGLGDRHVRFGFGRKSFPEALSAFAEYLDP